MKREEIEEKLGVPGVKSFNELTDVCNDRLQLRKFIDSAYKCYKNNLEAFNNVRDSQEVTQLGVNIYDYLLDNIEHSLYILMTAFRFYCPEVTLDMRGEPRYIQLIFKEPGYRKFVDIGKLDEKRESYTIDYKAMEDALRYQYDIDIKMPYIEVDFDSTLYDVSNALYNVNDSFFNKRMSYLNQIKDQFNFFIFKDAIITDKVDEPLEILIDIAKDAQIVSEDFKIEMALTEN